MHQETFIELLRSPGHWAFELFLMAIFDGILGALALPFLKKHWREHAKAHHHEESLMCPDCRETYLALTKCPCCRASVCAPCLAEHLDFSGGFTCEPYSNEGPDPMTICKEER